MSHTISVRLPEETSRRLEEQARQSGRSRSAIVKEALEQSLQSRTKTFMALAGTIEGAPDLSQRKGFAKK
ncbi:MAG: ribbon-helix-helix domain-containing protein [Opitutales bacterium]